MSVDAPRRQSAQILGSISRGTSSVHFDGTSGRQAQLILASTEHS